MALSVINETMNRLIEKFSLNMKCSPSDLCFEKICVESPGVYKIYLKFCDIRYLIEHLEPIDQTSYLGQGPCYDYRVFDEKTNTYGRFISFN